MLSPSSLTLVARRAACTCKPTIATRTFTTSFRSLSSATAPAPTLHPTDSGLQPPHLLTLADLTVPQIERLVKSAIAFKKHYKAKAVPEAGRIAGAGQQVEDVGEAVKEKTLDGKTVALMFSKRSTRTRVASETAVQILGACLLQVQ